MERVELLTPAKNLKAIIAASKYADSINSDQGKTKWE
jgi:hypothetical protein